MEIMGVRIPTIQSDTVAIRCHACHEVIEGTPWRISILDVVAPEAPPSWADRSAINPGPFEFHPDPSHVRAWMRRRGLLFCRKGEVREIMRPVRIPAGSGEPDAPERLGLCDGIHRDAHEFIPA